LFCRAKCRHVNALYLVDKQLQSAIIGRMYIAAVPNRTSKPAILLRESYREGGKVKTRTIANLSKLPGAAVEALRRTLAGEKLVTVDEIFQIVASRHHGHVAAVLSAMKQLDFADLLGSRRSRQRDLVVGMVAAKLLQQKSSKLSTTSWWKTTTLAETLGVEDANEDDLYAAMDWLLERQERIEKKLAARHLQQDGLVLYDLSSSYFEGASCPLAARGYSRDKKKGKLQVNYGLMSDPRGCPVAISVFEGNTSDPKTLLPQVAKARDSFGLERLVLVGDRGMITQKQVDALKDIEGLEWITALKTGSIRKLVESGNVQLDLFDERNLFELEHPDFPGERLVACRNPALAKLRKEKRLELLAATARELEKVRGMAGSGKLKGQDAIGVRVGRVVNQYKMAKHFLLDIRDERFDFQVDEAKVASEAALDGLYVVRTSLPAERLDMADTVRSYKSLALVERAFRSLKTMDLHVRPIHHHLEKRVRAHIFLCMLAYYVQWHMQEALRPLTFADEEVIEDRKTRDPVAPAERSASAKRKASTKRLEDGTPVQSYRGILENLATIVRNTNRRPGANDDEAPVFLDTAPSPIQQRALDLIAEISP
jgi:transposase